MGRYNDKSEGKSPKINFAISIFIAIFTENIESEQ